MQRPDDIAVVIGVKEYANSDVPNVDYAVRDAETMKKYLTRTLGFREENIIYIENANGSDFTRIFGTSDNPQGQLYDWVKPGESSVFVYYSGHGAPNPGSGQAYFVPSDADPNYLSQNGYRVNQFYENLAQLPAESVTVVLEACFSGVSTQGPIVREASPVELSVENPVMAMEDGLAFTAGQADQIASWYSEQGHGLFTYYFLKGIRGDADENDDLAVTAREIEKYLTNKVPYRARRMHSREQIPQVLGRDKDRTLVQYEEDNFPIQTQMKARLPVQVANIGSEVAEALSLPLGAKKVVAADESARLQPEDVIISVGGSDLTDESSLNKVLGRLSPGDTIRLEILRDGQNRSVSVRLVAPN